MNASHGKTYWRSLGELQDAPEFRQFVEREFPVAASEFPEGMSRRRWMQLMGASLALGGLTGCRWEAEKIAPFAMRPENRIPGEAERFATSIEVAGMPRHLLVTCYDGRPIKIEGNPEHPASQGATDVFAQASILGLYDPDRSDTLRQRQGRQQFTRSWNDFERFAERHFKALQQQAGQGMALLMEPTTSATEHTLLKRIRQRFPNAGIFSYASLSPSNEMRGSELAFERPLRTRFNLGSARIIVCMDADLLGVHANATAHARDFTAGRDPEKEMNRLYVVESQFSITGAAADHRLPLKSHSIGLLLAHVDQKVRERLEIPVASLSNDLPAIEDQFLAALVDDLIANRGQSLVAVGSNQPPEVHALAHELNYLLGNFGRTMFLNEEPSMSTTTRSIRELVEEISNGQVDTLLIVGGNPVYDAPGDLGFADEIAKVPTTIRLGLYEDETSLLSTWHLPQAHDYESWRDVRAWNGTLGVAQPLIAPLLNGKSAIEVLGLICNDRREPQKMVREAVGQAHRQPLSDDNWAKLLHDGFLPNSALPVVKAEPRALDRERLVDALVRRASSDMEIVFTASPSVLDGRFANNGWLQETPDFLTKLTWDNAAIISPGTAEELGIEHGTIVRIKRGSVEIELPAFVLPGQAPNSIGLAIGYGRRAAGVIGGSAPQAIPTVGRDVNPLRRWDAMNFTSDVTIIPTKVRYEFATTQDHHAIDTVGIEETSRRVGELVREGTVTDYQEHPDFAQHASHHNPLESLWKEPSYDGHAWGMSIDLNRCIGCNACVVACQAENNVPIVGKDQVVKGREMHWIRVDRYFRGDVENPEVATQPVACQHCENAPCEQVCPVAATVHSDEGLNDMVYNRCVGTRYCANNCPYKVRRFNFFDYNKELEEPNRQLAQLSINPEVTVRSRGVMEKCTYCVQRIQSVKIDAKNDHRPIQDGEIKTACQQACPAQAIEFGDLNDSESRVSKAHADPRAYGMLSELNVKPRTKYLARIRNPNPALINWT